MTKKQAVRNRVFLALVKRGTPNAADKAERIADRILKYKRIFNNQYQFFNVQ